MGWHGSCMFVKFLTKCVLQWENWKKFVVKLLTKFVLPKAGRNGVKFLTMCGMQLSEYSENFWHDSCKKNSQIILKISAPSLQWLVIVRKF